MPFQHKSWQTSDQEGAVVFRVHDVGENDKSQSYSSIASIVLKIDH